MIGKKVSHYRILERLGGGGMGEVYKAEDTRLGRLVALKFLSREVADGEALERFRREARMASTLDHPHICSIYDVGDSEGQPFMVLQLLHGETLQERIQDKPLPLQESFRLAIQVAEGLEAAHSKGVVHRDIKASNIFVNDREDVVILDFGLAKLVEQRYEPGSASEAPTVMASETLTSPGVAMGTVFYMSPEQLLGEQLDARTDLYSFGVLLYQMATGTLPFRGRTFAALCDQILHEDPPPPSHLNADLPPEFDWVVAKALEKDRELRYQSAREVAADLRRLSLNTGSGSTRVRLERPPDAGSPSIAVLPFVSLGPDPENDYFSDGLSEELINALGRVSKLRVASRTSAFSFKGTSQRIRQIGALLNVRTVLEGSVRRSENRLRVSAQLVDVENGYQFWAQTFDREIEDVLSIQEEIAGSIVKALELVLSEGERNKLLSVGTSRALAYDCYLRGRQLFYQFRRAGYEKARRLFLEAASIDPDYAAAHAWVANCCWFLYTWFDVDPAYISEADQASRKALASDPELAEAQVARGVALLLARHYAEAEEAFERAVREKADLFEALYFHARACFSQGKLEQAAGLAEGAAQVRSRDYNASYLAGMAYLALARADRAEAAFRRSLEAAGKHLELFPGDGRALYVGAAAAIRLGEDEKGRDWAVRAVTADPGEPMTLYGVACDYSLLGETEEALDCLEKASTFGPLEKAWFLYDPDLDSIRDHPRFQALLERL